MLAGDRLKLAGDHVIVAGDGHGFSVKLTVAEYAEWAKLWAACDWQAADAFLLAIVATSKAKD